ncbi:hypothetical protein Kpho02_19880 [Kitasatospora phosalacinea]|uniref:Uncharacterized protein n=1 Tax=Kitasatospora phosalacinea TaxID=2065 RepID=A0A9W6Q4F4_9ACTN|nr:hypothetical protein Kpho02_19880 [Kitasatospora phosalacinea]
MYGQVRWHDRSAVLGPARQAEVLTSSRAVADVLGEQGRGPFESVFGGLEPAAQAGRVKVYATGEIGDAARVDALPVQVFAVQMAPGAAGVQVQTTKEGAASPKLKAALEALAGSVPVTLPEGQEIHGLDGTNLPAPSATPVPVHGRAVRASGSGGSGCPAWCAGVRPPRRPAPAGGPR